MSRDHRQGRIASPLSGAARVRPAGEAPLPAPAAPAYVPDAWPLPGDAAPVCVAGMATPRRRLVATLQDAHAEARLRIDMLRGCSAVLAAADAPVRTILARLLDEAEEQLRRFEILLAWLRERPASGCAPALGTQLMAILVGATRQSDAVFVALAAVAQSGAEEARRLRNLAWKARQNLGARLLELTIAEQEAAARDLEALLLQPRDEAGRQH